MKNIEKSKYIVDLKVFSIILMFLYLIIFEAGIHNKLKHNIWVSFEGLVLGIFTLIFQYVFEFSTNFRVVFLPLVLGILYNVYYVVKMLHYLYKVRLLHSKKFFDASRLC
jgi:hypothetical protein